MKIIKKLMLAFTVLFIAILVLVSLPANAATFTNITVIGDSLFDGGNEDTAVISAYKLWGTGDGFTARAGYYKFKYCNGYTGAEYFAYYMGMYDKTHFFNYAVAGLSSIELPQVLAKIYEKSPNLDPKRLFVIFVGGHDVFQSKISRDQTAENIKNAVADLYSHGARYFMVINLPMMGDFPNYNVLPAADINAANVAYKAINTALAEKLSTLSYAKYIVQFDTANFSSLINQYAGSVGFTNIKSACYNSTSTCSTPKAYIYWDDVHFTDTTNSYFGSFMQSKLLEANLP